MNWLLFKIRAIETIQKLILRTVIAHNHHFQNKYTTFCNQKHVWEKEVSFIKSSRVFPGTDCTCSSEYIELLMQRPLVIYSQMVIELSLLEDWQGRVQQQQPEAISPGVIEAHSLLQRPELIRKASSPRPAMREQSPWAASVPVFWDQQQSHGSHKNEGVHRHGAYHPKTVGSRTERRERSSLKVSEVEPLEDSAGKSNVHT